MADKKITQLPASTVPLAGTEVLPIVQGTTPTTKQVSVANLTAGRDISANSITLSTGNLVIGTSGKGIDFSATPGTGTSELLADYEEGTHTATVTCQTSGTVTLNTFFETLAYTKVGRQVTVTGFLLVDSVSSPTGYFTVSLPFAISNGLAQQSARVAGNIIVGGSVSSVANGFIAYGLPNESLFRVYMSSSNNAIGNTSAQQLQANAEIFVQFTYFV